MLVIFHQVHHLSSLEKQVFMTRKCHNHTLQTNQQHLEEDIWNNNSHMTDNGSNNAQRIIINRTTPLEWTVAKATWVYVGL